mmetsp:Transcript_38623/g.78912  ORF Transcript_38623/g.78912 Transcript_38623/m.78912 type:complete len:100 (-) Transcript_38623:781-1080(-)
MPKISSACGALTGSKSNCSVLQFGKAEYNVSAMPVARTFYCQFGRCCCCSCCHAGVHAKPPQPPPRAEEQQVSRSPSAFRLRQFDCMDTFRATFAQARK